MKRRTVIGIIFVAGAFLKLASMWNIVNLDWLWKHPWTEYLGPIILLYVGVELIIDSYRRNPEQWLRRPVPTPADSKRIHCSVSFGGDEYIYQGERFSGARLDAFLGGIRMDLREALISEDEEIDIHTFLGGVELLVARDVKVDVKSRSFIGGVGNEINRHVISDAPCLHIIASNFLGGVTIKN